MEKIFVIILFLISNLNHLKCADNYEMGDILYVWAKSGLNVRVGPGTDNHVIAKVLFGESVLVWGKTDRTYNVMGIDTVGSYRYSQLKVEPVIFKGNWVQIQMLDGQVGYVIDQYLLIYKPHTIERNSYPEMNLRLIATDTIFRNPVFSDGEGLNYKIRREYEGGIVELEKSGGVWSNSEFSVPNATIEETLVLYSASRDNFNNSLVLKNWNEEVILHYSICNCTITQKEGQVVVVIGCSC